MTQPALSIRQFAQVSGLTTHTIRYYESLGVLQPNKRAANGHRRYVPDDLKWIEFVLKLKATGMPLAEIKRYADLRALGEGTVAQRLAMLTLHRELLAQTIAELAACLCTLDHKIETYQTQVAEPGSSGGKTPNDR